MLINICRIYIIQAQSQITAPRRQFIKGVTMRIIRIIQALNLRIVIAVQAENVLW